MLRLRKLVLMDLVAYLLYVLFFGGVLLETRWMNDHTSVNDVTLVKAFWAIAVSGVAIAVMQTHRWKTGYPVPIQFFGIGFGLQALGGAFININLLLAVYYGVAPRVIDYAGAFLFIVGTLCMFVWAIRGR